jgi:hypothetical protein
MVRRVFFREASEVLLKTIWISSFSSIIAFIIACLIVDGGRKDEVLDAKVLAAAVAQSLGLVIRWAGDRGRAINKLKIIFDYEIFSLLRKPVILPSAEWVQYERFGRQWFVAGCGSVQCSMFSDRIASGIGLKR